MKRKYDEDGDEDEDAHRGRTMRRRSYAGSSYSRPVSANASSGSNADFQRGSATHSPQSPYATSSPPVSVSPFGSYNGSPSPMGGWDMPDFSRFRRKRVTSG
jgi:hypothetical protein